MRAEPADPVQMGGEPPTATDDPLVVFLYLLLRNEIPAGVAEGLVLEIEGRPDETSLSNSYLAGYAANLVRRLRRETRDER